VLRVALPAVDWLAFYRLERDIAFLFAVCAYRFVHLARGIALESSTAAEPSAELPCEVAYEIAFEAISGFAVSSASAAF
jgi:hypothetical protein